MIKSYDFGIKNIVEDTQRIEIDEIVRQANKELKLSLIQAKIEALGINIELSSSKTRYNGCRYWFACPHCNRRVGVLYSLFDQLGCRTCFRLKYKAQRYKGMIESKI